MKKIVFVEEGMEVVHGDYEPPVGHRRFNEATSSRDNCFYCSSLAVSEAFIPSFRFGFSPELPNGSLNTHTSRHCGSDACREQARTDLVARFRLIVIGK